MGSNSKPLFLGFIVSATFAMNAFAAEVPPEVQGSGSGITVFTFGKDISARKGNYKVTCNLKSVDKTIDGYSQDRQVNWLYANCISSDGERFSSKKSGMQLIQDIDSGHFGIVFTNLPKISELPFVRMDFTAK